MDLHGFPWICIDLHGFPMIPMDLHGFAWICMDIHRFPWISNLCEKTSTRTSFDGPMLHLALTGSTSADGCQIHENPWIAMGWIWHGFAWNSMDLDGFAWISMEFHTVAWIAIDSH